MDSNIFYRIARRKETDEICAWIKAKNARVLFSDVAMAEIDQINDIEKRRERYLIVGKLCNYLDNWATQLEAQEFISEVRRCRPNWLSTFIHVPNRLGQVLEGRKRTFEALRQGALEEVFEHRASTRLRNRNLKKQLATTQKRSKNKEFDGCVYDKSTNNLVRRWPIYSHDDKWRADFMMTWWDATAERQPNYEDFQICTDHLLSRGALLSSRDFDVFCFKEVNKGNVPLNRIRSASWHAQLGHEIKKSNNADNGHASHLFCSDLFVTSDVIFTKVLASVKNLVDYPARIVFVPYEGDPTVSYIDKAWD